MPALKITLTNGARIFVEDQAAQAQCTPDEYVQYLLEDLEKSVQRRKLNDMLLDGYRELRKGHGRILTDADWQRLERRIERRVTVPSPAHPTPPA